MATGTRSRSEEREFSGGEVRQGDIILRSRWRRAIFIAGLAGVVLLAIFLAIRGG